MIKQLKQFTVNLVSGANVALVALLCLSGYSDHLSPEKYPLLSCMGIVFPILLIGNLAFLLFWLTFKWRRMWIPLAGFALVFLPIRTYFPLNMSQTPPEDALKIISYNVCTYGGNYKYENAFDTIYNSPILSVSRRMSTHGASMCCRNTSRRLPITIPLSSSTMPSSSTRWASIPVFPL